MFLPENDGIDHINVYSKGKTELGRFLSNFTYCKINTEDGNFNSIEGYWYWLGTNDPKREILRGLYGFQAKKVGRELKSKDWQESEQFKQKILKAIQIKINNNPKYKEILKNNTLPLTHYYVFNDTIIRVPQGQWILDGIKESIKQ